MALSRHPQQANVAETRRREDLLARGTCRTVRASWTRQRIGTKGSSFTWQVKCSLVSIKTVKSMAEGLGECNSYETVPL